MTVVSDQMWSLHLEAPLGAVEAEKSIIWSSSPASLYPTSKELSQLLAVKGIEPNDLTNLAVQIVRNAPVSALPNLLNSIACHYWRNESSLIDVRMMDNLHNANHRTVCGLVFRKGDIVWMCRTCAKDPTCVQCDACFKRSDHVDHEVYFHRASGRGGCCDCGDPEAWALCGNCTEHSIVANQLEIDPLTVLPADLLKGFRAVVAGVVGVIVSYSTGTVRGLESYADNSFVFEAERINELKGKPVKLKVRLHNDDVHTYEEVILALTSFDISNSLAQAMTVAVDQEGEASIITGEVTDNRLSRASRVLGSQAGLLVSIVPDKLATIGPSVAAALSWLVSFGNSNDGLRRAVTEVFMQETESLPSCASAVPDLGVPSPNMIFVDLPAGRSNQFPNAIQHLRSNVPDRLAEDTLNKMLRCSPFTICPRNGLAILLMASPYLNPAMSKLTNDLVIVYQQDSQFKLVFSQVVTLLYPALYGLYFRSIGTAKETVFVSTVQVYTADSIVTMMSSEGVAERPLKERRDWPTNTAPVRKSKNERSLDAKRGKRETNVICRVDQPPEDPVNLMEVLTSTFLTLLADVGCTPGREDDKFASHHSIHTKRYGHLCRDLEYCSDNPWAAIKTLQGIRDSRVVEDWLEICTLLQCMYRFRRRIGTHMEQEDYKWQDAANLVLQLETVSSIFISNALLSPITTYNPTQGASVSAFVCTADSDLTDVSLHRRFAIGVALEKAFFALACWFNTHLLLPSAFCSDDQDLFFNANGTVYPISLLGCRVHFPGIRRYTVSHSPVSVHLPIHRFISKMLDFAAYADLGVSDVISRLIPTLAFTLADFPLRCLSFCAQVRCGMWRRNGSMSENLAYNYDRPPLCKSLRNTDLTSIQTAILVLGPDTALALTIDRYELTSFLVACYNSKELTAEVDKLLEYRGALLADLLKTVVLLMTYLPSSLVKMETSTLEREKRNEPVEEEKGCRITLALKREISHLLLSGGQSMSVSQLQRAKKMIGSTEMVTDKMMRLAVEDLCDKREDLLAGKNTLELRSLAFELFDPEYINLSSQKQQRATDRVKDHRRKKAGAGPTGSKDSAGIPLGLPVITPAAVPIPHRDYVKTRRMLFQPLMCSMLEMCLKCCLTQPKVLGGSVSAIINRVIHIATLQLHCQAEISAFDLQAQMTTEGVDDVDKGDGLKGEGGSSMEVVSLPEERETDKGNEKRKLNDEETDRPAGIGAAGCFFSHFFAQGRIVSKPIETDLLSARRYFSIPLTSSESSNLRPGTGGNSDPSASSSSSSSVPMTHTNITEGADNDPQALQFNGAGRGFLSALADIWLAGTIRDDEYYHQGLTWVLQQLSAKSPDACALLVAKGITFEYAVAAQSGRDAIAKRRQEAQRRAVNAMNRQAASFAMGIPGEDETEDESDLVGQEVATAAVSFEDGAPECIFCREKSGDVMGYLAFLQTSSTIKRAVQRHSDCKEMESVYRVVALSGANVTFSAAESSKLVGHVGHGEHVLVGSRSGRWMRVVSPIAGWIPLYQRLPLLPKSTEWPTPARSAALQLPERNQRLLNTYEGPQTPGKAALEVILHPVADLQFNHFGGDRVHVSTCGHAMHLKCHDTVLASVSSSNYEGGQVIDVKRKELLCPLCKSIGNTILPHTPPHIASASLPQTVTPTTTAVAVEGGLMDLSTLLSTNHESFSEALLIHVRSLLAAPKSAMGVEGESSVLESSDSTSSPEVPTVEVTTSASALYNSSFRKAIMRNFLPRWHLDSTMERLLGLAVPDLGRCIHLSWSAAAYTLLSASRAKFWLDSDCAEAVRGCGVLSPVVDEKEVSLVYQLLLLLRSVPPSMGGTDFNLEEGIITPLSNLLAGVQTTSTASIFRRKDGRREEKSCVLTDYPTDDDIRSAVLSQPLLCVGSLAFPDVKRQSMILAQSFRSAISPTERWPFMLTPLLEHDLHTIAIAFAAATGSVEKALEALSLLSLARLAQILIEPAATGVAAANSSLAADLLKADTGCFGTHKKEGGQDIEVVLTPPRVMVIDPHVCYDIVDIEMDSMQIAADRVRGIDVSDSDSNFGGSSRKREREGWPREGIKDAVITTGSIHSSTAALCEQLAQLRDMLYLSCGYTISATSTSGSERAAEQRVTPPVGRELLAGVVDSWIPFLEFCCSLRVVLLSGLGVDDVVIGRQAGVKVVHIDAAYEQLHCDMTHLTYLLQTLRVIVPPPLSTASLPVADESTLLSSLPHDDVTSHLQTLMGSPGLSSMFDAWGSQLAANTTTPNQSDSATESWVPEPALGTKAPAKIAESTLTIGEVCTNGKVEGATCETISSLIESPAHTEEVAIDEEDEHLDDIAHFDEDGDDDDDDDEDENYEDDDDFADSEEEGDAELGFFQQQIAGFLAEQPDDENLFNGGAEMGGVMAAVMQHLGMEPDEVLPANLAAIFQNIQPPNDSGLSGQGGRTVWRMVGVDPANVHIDAHSVDFHDEASQRLHTLAPFRASITGRAKVYGIQGMPLKEGFCDLSHFGMGNRHRGGFISLPLVYTDLHKLTTFPDSLPGRSVDEPAVCLLCGQILNAGIRGIRGTGSGPDATPVIGECTLHARSCGAGVGVFFLVQKCSVLLMRGPRTCLYPSIYLDQNGDEPDSQGEMSPMFLSQKNVRRLEEMYLGHHVAREVTRRRASQERVTRLNWY